jgi:hypothetical protein
MWGFGRVIARPNPHSFPSFTAMPREPLNRPLVSQRAYDKIRSLTSVTANIIAVVYHAKSKCQELSRPIPGLLIGQTGNKLHPTYPSRSLARTFSD